MKFRRVLLLMLGIAALAGLVTVAYAQVPLCADIGGATNPVVLAGGGFCRVIAVDGTYLNGRSAGEIGNDAVIDLGVIHAVDVFNVQGGKSVPSFESPVQVCLQGQGALIFLDSTQSPRIPQRLLYFFDGEYSCSYILNTGTLVLVPTTDAPPLPVPGSVPVVVEGTAEVGPDGEVRLISQTVPEAVTLTNCRVRMNNRVNLRTLPSLQGQVIDILPFALTLTATERTAEWYRVIYLDGQGWVNTQYADGLSGACDGPAPAATATP